VIGDQSNGGHERVSWEWGIFDFRPLQWCILVNNEAVQNLHLSNANFDFQNSSNANANSCIYFISGKSECSALV